MRNLKAIEPMVEIEYYKAGKCISEKELLKLPINEFQKVVIHFHII